MMMMMMKKVMINYYHYWLMMMNIVFFQPQLKPFRLREASRELDTDDEEEKARDFLAGFGAGGFQ